MRRERTAGMHTDRSRYILRALLIDSGLPALVRARQPPYRFDQVVKRNLIVTVESGNEDDRCLRSGTRNKRVYTTRACVGENKIGVSQKIEPGALWEELRSVYDKKCINRMFPGGLKLSFFGTNSK